MLTLSLISDTSKFSSKLVSNKRSYQSEIIKKFNLKRFTVPGKKKKKKTVPKVLKPMAPLLFI